MQLALWMLLTLCFATNQYTYGDDSVKALSYDSIEDEPFDDLETDDDLDELDDEAEEFYKRVSGEKDVKPKNKTKNPNKNKNKDFQLQPLPEEVKNRWFKPLGCYHDAGPIAWRDPSYRALRRLYLNVRGEIRNWTEEYFEHLALKCAIAAQPRGCKCFGIQFFGECWCHTQGCKTFAKYGPSDNCEKGVGKNWTNYVYSSNCGSEYGCCKDNSMPASGKDYDGCPDCKTAVDLVIVVDSSGSIGKDDFETVKQMAVNIIRHFSVRRAYARIGIIRYSSYVTPIITPQASQRRGFERLKRRILRMAYMRGLTMTGLALQEAYKMLIESRQQVYKSGKIINHHQVCIVVTDGLASDSARLNFATIKLKSIAKVIALGVKGKNYDKAKRDKQLAELQKIATDSQKDVFFKANFDKLMESVNRIAKRACPLVKQNP